MDNKTFLGLDIGSSSIGWAVTDENFNLKTLNGKAAWGSRLFDEASDAKNRRQFRCNKRRIKRRKSRLYLLNKMFEQHITSFDESFFIRLSQSNLSNDEETKKFIYPLFNDKNLEKNFYKKYPTIYHLRYSLINNDYDAFKDIRFLYLAIHHIVKYRGNFLSNGNVNISSLNPNLREELNEAFNIVYNKILQFEDGDVDEENIDFIQDNFNTAIIDILLNTKLNKRDKKKEIISLFNIPNIYKNEIKQYIDMFASLCLGLNFELSKIDEKFGESEISSICFSDQNYEEIKDTLSNLLDDTFTIVDIAKNIFDFVSLKTLIGDSKFLSEAFIKIYDLHKKQLKDLKNILIDIDRNKKSSTRVYDCVFKKKVIKSKDDKEILDSNYYAFNETKSNVSLSDFNSFIAKILNENKEFVSSKNVVKLNLILKECENKEFLKRISNLSTSSIPHQLHENELKIILKNAQKHFDFIDENFANRITEIFLFKVPYYYGPFNSSSENSNIVKVEGKEDTLITFDNYKEIIDEEKTKEKFINVKLNYCSYLYNEYTLPRNSYVYTIYVILDRLNTLRVNGIPLSFNDKVKLIDHICSFKDISVKKVKEYLCEINHYNGDICLSGINEKDNFVGYPVNVFRSIFVNEMDIQNHLKDIEEIIKILTIYKDDTKEGIEIVKKKFTYLTNDQIRELSKLKLNGYGCLSYKLLNGIVNDEHRTIIQEMFLTGNNFQQVLQSFTNVINEENRKIVGEGFDERKKYVEELLENTPSIFRRSIIQALKIIKEVKHFNKGNIDVISLEVTREDLQNKDKKETSERRKINADLIKQVESIKGSGEIVSKIKENAELTKENLDSLKDTIKLKSKHIYLYFLQLGIDMYTGKPINFEDVLRGTTYDIDHIYPQSKIKDDSLNNTVLVDKQYNQKIKGDKFPIPFEIRQKMENTWKVMKEYKLISQEKFNRLTRVEPLSDDELNDFVSRQLNVVNYANKRLKEIIEILYGESTKVVFSKAQYPHELRNEYGIYKIRELNDAHHAVDAYLNIVSGITLNQLFGNLRVIKSLDYNRNIGEKSYNFMKRLLGYLNNRNLKDVIINTCYRDDPLLTYRFDYGTGEFYKQTIFKKGEGNLIPIHKNGPLSDATKYGGYSSLSTSYFVVGYYLKKDKKLKTLVRVPTMTIAECKNKNGIVDTNLLKNKLLKLNENLVDIDVNNRILNNTKVNVRGGEYLLRSNNEERCALKNLNQLFLTKENTFILYMLLKRSKGKEKIILNRQEETFVFDRKLISNLYLELKDKSMKLVDLKYTARPFINDLLEKNVFELPIEEIVNDVNTILNYLSTKSSKIWKPCLHNVCNDTIQYKIIENATGLYSKKVKI